MYDLTIVEYVNQGGERIWEVTIEGIAHWALHLHAAFYDMSLQCTCYKRKCARDVLLILELHLQQAYNFW